MKVNIVLSLNTIVEIRDKKNIGIPGALNGEVNPYTEFIYHIVFSVLSIDSVEIKMICCCCMSRYSINNFNIHMFHSS